MCWLGEEEGQKQWEKMNFCCDPDPWKAYMWIQRKGWANDILQGKFSGILWLTGCREVIKTKGRKRVRDSWVFESEWGSNLSFPGGLDSEEPACYGEDLVLERSPGEENGYPFQYSCLENPMGRGAWEAVIVHGVTKSMTQQTDRQTHTHTHTEEGNQIVGNEQDLTVILVKALAWSPPVSKAL